MDETRSEVIASLDDRIKECNITPDDLKCRCTLKHAAEIAKHFSQWYQASAHLNITPDEVAAIRSDNKNKEEDVRKAFLEKWITKNGDKSTYRMLLDALTFCERNDLVELLLKLIKDAPDAPDGDDDGLALESGDDIKEEDMRFLCGCGTCSLESFLENGCPNPWAKSQYPLLDIEKLSYRKRLELFSRLEKELNTVTEKFGSLTRKMLKSLKETQCDTKELVVYLLPQQKFADLEDEARKELLSEIKKAKDVGDVMMLLTGNIISWFNHPLLGSIASEFEVCKADYEEYVSKVFNPYMKRCLFEVPCNTGQELKGSGKFILKVTTLHLEHKDKTKAEILLSLRSHVSKVCGIAIDAFDICSYGKGCLRVTVAAPLALLEEIFPLSDDALNLLSFFSYEGARIKSISFREHYHPVPNKSVPKNILSEDKTTLTDLINKFASLVVELHRSIKEKLPEAKQYLQKNMRVFQLRSKADYDDKLFLESVHEEIENASTAADLIIILNTFWSFYNHILLSGMIRSDRFCNEDVKSNLKKYINSLGALPVTEYPPLVQSYTNEEFFHSDLLIVKVEKLNGINGDTLDDIRDSIACWLNIESRVLLLKKIRKKTNELEYLIPKCVHVTIIKDTSFPISFQRVPVISISFGKNAKNCGITKSHGNESDSDSGFQSTGPKTYSSSDESSSTSCSETDANSPQPCNRRSTVKNQSQKLEPCPPQQTRYSVYPNAGTISSQGGTFLHSSQLSVVHPHVSQAVVTFAPQVLLHGLQLPLVYPHIISQAPKSNKLTLVPESMTSYHYNTHTRPKTVQELVNWKTNFQSRLENTTLQETEVEAELTVGNYRNKFYYLLCYEESAHIRLLTEKCDGEYILNLSFYSHGYSAILKGMDGNRIQYATQASEAVFLLHSGTREVICKATILPINYHNIDDDLVLGLSSSAVDALKEKAESQIYAEFEVKHSYFDILHEAVVNVPRSMILKIMPSTEAVCSSPSFTLHITETHEKSLIIDRCGQLKALQLILNSSPNVPVVVSGPFGTGKTRVLGRATYEFAINGLAAKKTTRILICAHHSNTIQRMTGVLSKAFEGNDRVKVVGFLRTYDSKSEAFGLVYNSVRRFADDVAQGEFVGDPVVVIIATYTTSLQVANALSFKYFRFTHILLDETAQVREPEAIAALPLGDENTKLVLAGDSKQDGPSVLVLGDVARNNGLKMSLLERLERRYEEIGGEHYLIHLDVNYRCHPMLTKFLSDVVYKYPIESAVTTDNSTKKGHFDDVNTCPCFFYCCHVNSDVPSNVDAMEVEAKAVICWLEDLESEAKNIKEKKKKSENDICVVSSFRKQINIIKNEMKKGKFKNVSVKPTYMIQGHEYNTLIISTYEPLEADGTSADSTKTLVLPEKFNTVVSRSKRKVIAVGNPFRLLRTEERMGTSTKCWREYIRFCIRNNTMLYSEGLEKHSLILEADVGISSPQRSASVAQPMITSAPPTPVSRAKSDNYLQRLESKSKERTSTESVTTLKQEQKFALTKSSEEKEKKLCTESLEHARDIEQDKATVVKELHKSQSATEELKYTLYKKPALTDSPSAITSKREKKKKQKKISKTTIAIPFYHSHSVPAPLDLEVGHDDSCRKPQMAKSDNFVTQSVSYAEKLKN